MFATTLLTLFKGKRVGVDKYGNKYYEEKFLFSKLKNRKRRRWVIYKGVPEASKATPEWHGWLHYTTDIAPIEIKRETYTWEKDYIPNATGTSQAYRPPTNIKAKPYVSWQPKGSR